MGLAIFFCLFYFNLATGAHHLKCLVFINLKHKRRQWLWKKPWISKCEIHFPDWQCQSSSIRNINFVMLSGFLHGIMWRFEPPSKNEFTVAVWFGIILHGRECYITIKHVFFIMISVTDLILLETMFFIWGVRLSSHAP